ncbi:dipeptide epimerase [Thalassobacillus pellis]|uniref:dipeptide epimerase n=1 Tax=Thalassobacillus pellis TaxID=748008 RepID=UPI00195F6CAE|nr:dipeptide epimerase [Thalassobacillus pellis]
MNITDIKTYLVEVPLHTPFKTALRTVTTATSIFVEIHCGKDIRGWGEAPPTHVITGETLESISYSIEKVIKPLLLGQSLYDRNALFEMVEKALVRNTSAKAAVDMAIHDCLAQYCSMPLFQFLGGYRHVMETDYTVGVNSPEEMAADAIRYKDAGFDTLKIKVGNADIQTDFKRVQAVRTAVGDKILLRLDANQGWKPKEAVSVIRRMEESDFNIELVEQPVAAHDLSGLKFVTEHVDTLIMADESVFSVHDARKVLETNSADLINIKLMKTGGIHHARKLCHLAESYGVECMVGSMIETKLGLTAAAHFAASEKNVTRIDFDAPLMLQEDVLTGGIHYQGKKITFSDAPGLGINKVKEKFFARTAR